MNVEGDFVSKNEQRDPAGFIDDKRSREILSSRGLYSAPEFIAFWN